jgi:hypothetical protein
MLTLEQRLEALEQRVSEWERHLGLSVPSLCRQAKKGSRIE